MVSGPVTTHTKRFGIAAFAAVVLSVSLALAPSVPVIGDIVGQGTEVSAHPREECTTRMVTKIRIVYNEIWPGYYLPAYEYYEAPETTCIRLLHKDPVGTTTQQVVSTVLCDAMGGGVAWLSRNGWLGGGTTAWCEVVFERVSIVWGPLH